MKIGTWRDTHPWMFNTYFEGENGGGGGTGGEGGGATPPVDAGSKGSDKTLSQSDVDRIVQERVGETKRKTQEDLAKQLGVSVEEAKKIIEEHQKQQDKDKSDAQIAREAADREKAEAGDEKQSAALERHNAAVERQLIRALPKDLDDEALDAKLTRLSRLIDVEVGASTEDIKKAVEALKKDEPLLFGAPEEKGKGGAPGSDPKGTPPKSKGSEDAFARGAERAKTAASREQYAILGEK